MQYNNIKKVSNYQTQKDGDFIFCIGQNDKCFFAIINNENNMQCEKANSIAVAKQILLNHLYKFIHKDSQYNKEKIFILEQIKKFKTEEIVNFKY